MDMNRTTMAPSANNNNVNQESMKYLNFTRWLILAVLMIAGNLSLSGQTAPSFESTCECTDEGVRVRDSIVFTSATEVMLVDYSGYFLPDSALYLGATSDEFYLSSDLPQEDILTDNGDGTWTFVSYRNGNIPFSEINFVNTAGTTFQATFPICSATVDDAITSSVGDTICLNDGTSTFTLPAGLMFDPTAVNWVITAANAATGSSTPATGSMTAAASLFATFNTAGNYNIAVSGLSTSNCPIDANIDVHIIDTGFEIEGFDFGCTGELIPFNLSAGFTTALYDTVTWTVDGAPVGVSFSGDSIDVGNVNIQFDNAGIYIVEVEAMQSEGAMCDFSDTFEITIGNILSASIVGDDVVCADQIRLYESNVNNLQSITWTSANGVIIGDNNTADVNVRFFGAGFDTLRVSGMTAGGCTVTDSIIVDIKDSNISLDGADEVCVGSVEGYRAMYSDATVANFTSIEWSVIPMNAGNTTALDTVLSPNDSLTVTWGAIGEYMIQVNGVTDLGCDLMDEFMVNVQDTAQVILGPTLVCAGDVLNYTLVQGTDSSAIGGTGIIWKVFRLINGTMNVGEAVADTDGDATLVHSFSTGTVNDDLAYVVVAEGVSANGCLISDSLRVETIGNQDLSIDGPITTCAGGVETFKLLLDTSLQTGPVTWSAFQKSNNAPVIPGAITQLGDTSAIIDFPNVADTFIVQVTGTAGPSCMFTVEHEIVITDNLSIVDAAAIDTLCLTGDSTWYAVNIDTALVDLASVTWSITNNAGGGAIFPAITGSGSSSFLSAAYVYPGPGIYTHRVRGVEEGTGCEFDEILEVTVKDTVYNLLGDTQICIGDTTEYVFLDANMMPLMDFDTVGGTNTLNWVIGGAPVQAGAVTGTGSLSSMSLGYSFAEFGAGFQDTIRIVWSEAGPRTISVVDSTMCCPIDFTQEILVRDSLSFMLEGPTEVCAGDTTGYKITAFGSAIDDINPDSTVWSVQQGSVLNAGTDSLTILWNVAGDFINTTDTITFEGYTLDGCPIYDTLVVDIRSLDVIVLGDLNVCQGDPINFELVNAADSSVIADLDSLYWIFSAGNDTLKLDSTVLDVWVDADSIIQNTWTEEGTYTIKTLGFTNGTCSVESEFIVMVNANPNPTIVGDQNTCINSSDVFSVDIDMSNIQSITWTAAGFAGTPSSGVRILSGQGTAEIIVQWDGTGDFYIDVMGVTTGGCTFTDRLETLVIDAANIGQLACNNNINVTLPDNCELQLTSGQILQKDSVTALIPEDQFEIVVEDAASGVRLSNDGIVDASLLGIELKVIITHECSGQTCWGFITLEDKTIPELLCSNDTIPCTTSADPSVLGFPVDAASTVTTVTTNPPVYDVAGFEKCGVARLTYNDRTSSEVCTGDYGTVIYRDWTLTNSAGLTSECTDTILIERINVDSMDLSGLGNFIGDEGFSCDEVTRADLEPGSRTGNLSVIATDYCFNAQATHSDVESAFCGTASYRLTRTWTILDWCSGNVRTHIQTIDVLDREGPSINLSSGPIRISATDHDCSGLYDLTPDVTISDNCSPEEGISTTLRIFENDETGSLLYTITDGDYSGLAFDPSVTQIFITVQATDDCNRSNQNSITREITITDDVKPIPICDESTTISIGSQGWAIADWHAFDDGSIDNCGIQDIQIRRMENNCSDFPENLQFGDYVKFCCQDAMLGEPILVQLRVTDVNGNVNECMVSVTVQDNSAISKVVAEGDRAISCQADVTPLLTDDGTTVTFLTATCGIPMAPDFFTAAVDTTDCGSGTIVRNWLITDELGNTLSHTQTITRGLPGETFDPADLASIWPADYEGEGCAGPNTTPESLPEAFRPNLDLAGYSCSSLGLDYEDLIFRDVEGLCAKVIRTWTLYDWCQRDPSNPDAGKWEYVQILKLTDTVDPVIITGCETETFAADSANSCSANVTTTAVADDCHASEDLIWSFEVTNASGIAVLQGNRSTISTTLEVGDYTVTWTATDPCGNSATCDKVLIVADTQEPNGVLVDISRDITVAGITVDGSDVVIRASDNCSDDANITVHFNTADGPTSLSFDCASMLGMDFRSIHPDVYLVDEAGNAWKGHVNISLSDPNNVCENSNNGGNTGDGLIAGQVFTEQDFTVDDVEVTLTTMNSGASTFEMTPLEGRYAFDNVTMAESYEISASRDDDYLNGVSTLDLVLIQRHILGLSTLDSPYKVIAADVDGSDHVSAIDLVHMRRLILGQTEAFPIGKPWTFVDASQVFDTPRTPFPYTEVLRIDDMSTDFSDMDFVGVKLGDVNGNVQLESALLGITRSIASIEVSELSTTGSQKVIGLTPNESAEIAGLQLSLGLNDNVQVVSVQSDVIEITEDNYTVVNNELRISWNDIEAVAISEDAFIKVTLRSTDASASIEEMITLTDTRITSEIYTEETGEIEVSDVFLSFADVASEGFVVEQNVPNPFNGQTNIKFYQPESSEVSFSIFDLSGRQVMNNKNTYAKGWHEINVSTADLPGAGIYIYEMSNGTDLIRKKMITID